MEQMTGTVVGVIGPFARVRVAAGNECACCTSPCAGGGPGKVVLRATNPIGARTGDRVRLTVRRGTRTRAGFRLYVLPLVCFLAGFLAATAVARAAGSGPHDGIGVLAGLALMAVPWLVTYLRRRTGRKATVSITARA